MKKTLLTAQMAVLLMGAGSASASRFFRANLSPDGNGGGLSAEDKAKAQAEVKRIAEEAAQAKMPDLIKSGLTSEEAKEAIGKIVAEALKTAKITDPVDEAEKTISDVVKEMQKQHDDLVQAFEKWNAGRGAEIKAQIDAFITEKHADIVKSFKEGKGFVELTTKDPATITTANGTNISPPAIVGTQLAPLQNVNLRDIPVMSLVNSFSTDLAAYAYTEAVPGEGDAAIVGEGGTKPQVDFDWATRYAQPYKVAAWLKLTEEAVQDVRGLRDTATNYLRKKHDLKKARLILFGTGSGSPLQPSGATIIGRAFVPGTMAGKVRFPNIMDVINAAITDIATTHNYQDEMPYMANIAMLNPVDFFLNFVAAKDDRGLPLYPQASLFNRVVIGGVLIVPEETIPAGKILVADLSKYNVSDYLPYTVKIGWINDDFIKNQFVILGESRFHAFVRQLDKQAFIYDDIANIEDEIAAPTT